MPRRRLVDLSAETRRLFIALRPRSGTGCRPRCLFFPRSKGNRDHVLSETPFSEPTKNAVFQKGGVFLVYPLLAGGFKEREVNEKPTMRNLSGFGWAGWGSKPTPNCF